MILAIASQKGGVGKTTTAGTMAAGLVKRKKKVLLIDLDPQTNLTFSTGIVQDEEKSTIYDLIFDEDLKTADALYETDAGYSFIAGDVHLTGADATFENEFDEEGCVYILQDVIEPVKKRFDYIIIDCPPTLGILTKNALVAANDVIIPIEADAYSLQGLAQMNNLITNAKSANKKLKVAGLLITKYNPRTKVHKVFRENLETLASKLKMKVFDATIRNTVFVNEAHILQQDLFTADPKHNVTKDYSAFVDEYLKSNK